MPTLAVVLTLMLAGRAMTLAFLADVGTAAAGAPPEAWLMPLVGDGVIGVTAPVMALLIVYGRGLAAWTAVVVWNALAIWDAGSAFLVHLSVPWPEFFMIRWFGWTMFPAAIGIHAVVLGLVAGPLRARLLGEAS